ncbi:hypothetical protein [Brasilonema sp. UFV-L1]|uniref:hypothetical protein n=1 Tax=Brasilonema sp. UFV-L1 TaxID=2234130 RepID=UPI00145E234A|nr:hypothetical protein [Brasilonema sp. UFV-L1]
MYLVYLQTAVISVPGQLRSPWAEWEPLTTEVQEVAEKSVMANCYDAKRAMQLFDNS